MKNTLIEIGGYTFKNPELVTKLGIVCDLYKLGNLPGLWVVAEKEAAIKLPGFKASEFRHQENQADGALVYSFRYYTPFSNVLKYVKGKDV